MFEGERHIRFPKVLSVVFSSGLTWILCVFRIRLNLNFLQYVAMNSFRYVKSNFINVQVSCSLCISSQIKSSIPLHQLCIYSCTKLTCLLHMLFDIKALFSLWDISIMYFTYQRVTNESIRIQHVLYRRSQKTHGASTRRKTWHGLT